MSDDEGDICSSTPLGKAFKSYKTPTSMFKVKTPTPREKVPQMKEGSTTPVSES